MYEHRSQPVVPRALFLKRLGRNGAFAGGIVVSALALGTVGYHSIGNLAWVDSLMNAAMILTGMGPVDPMVTDGAKLFATGYALFSGLVVFTTFAIAAAPVVHRFLHRFHLEMEDEGGERRKAPADKAAKK